ncbi:HNH endonuclease signature motif containing protein [Cryobacterium melibiosiphilum]|uniref:HNH endonuclease signature motif containing protein n=1 Tax=Cryobacterium melibiosiphilum TaxID=995039 RepID=UPI0013145B0E|nr:HNH endonuclease signature motif containing protein [Cryobacterium melibiosiphilum]
MTGPRTGGPRFTIKEEKARAEALINDPRSTGRIRAEFLIEALKVAASANPNEMFVREPALKIVATAEQPSEHPGVHPGGPPETGHRGRLVVGNGFVEGGSDPAPAAVIETLICDSGFTPVLFSFDGKPLDVGRALRLFNKEQRQALAVRDGGCMMPGCLMPPSWTETHHLDLYSTENGQTDIDVGMLFCATHHLRIHNDHWRVILKHGRYFLIPPATTDPDRTPMPLQSKSPLKLGSPFRLG